MKYFVTSDVHGFYDEFMKALNDKGFDVTNLEHKLIICGDVFDKGHQPKELIDFILTNKDKIIYIRGNHEDLMQDMINRNHNTYGDVYNGTAGTIVDLYPELRKSTKEEWNKSRWLNPVEAYRYGVYEPNKTIVCGHWHCSALWHEQNPELYDEFGAKEHFEPFVTDKMIALDACTAYSHKVNVVVLED